MPKVSHSVKGTEWVEKARETGKTVGRINAYYFSEKNAKFRSYADIEKYCKDKKYHLKRVTSILNWFPQKTKKIVF